MKQTYSASEVRKILENALDKPIAFHVIFARICNSAVAGLMLSQAWYWTPRTKDAQGWFYKTAQEWLAETAMSRAEQESSRKRLISLGLLQEERRGVPAKMYFRVDLDALYSAMAGYMNPLTLEEIIELYGADLVRISAAGYARAKKAGVKAALVSYADILRRDQACCHICKKAIEKGPGKNAESLNFYHVKQVKDGGDHTAENIRCSHLGCALTTSLLSDSKLECSETADKLAGQQQTITETTLENTSEITQEEQAAGAAASRFISIWNTHCGNHLAKVKSPTKKRAEKISARLRDKKSFEADFTAAVKHAAKTPFLCGNNEREWSADFDWMIKDDTNHVAVLEGKYDSKANGDTGSKKGPGIQQGAYHGGDESRFNRAADYTIV